MEQVEPDETEDAGKGEVPVPGDFGRLPTEREVLRAVWAARKELVRSEIHRRMPYAHRPTLGRVGQILSAFYEEGLLVRVQRKAQGSRRAGFYKLSEDGRQLCRQLGFEREEQLLFSASEEMLRDTLTRERLSWTPQAAGRVITAYGYRGGLGRTTMVAHVARGLAEKLPSDQRVLAVDLDLGAPGLDEFFARDGLGKCRGLGGLLVDYERLPPRKRSLWLRGALMNRNYVLPMGAEDPNLFYLPSGFSSGGAGLSSSERAEAVAILQAEAASLDLSRRDEAEPPSFGFLPAFLDALKGSFARTVVDCQFGNNQGAWIAVLSLADELVLCMDEKDISHSTVEGLRAVLANYLSNYVPDKARGGGVLFLFRLAAPRSEAELKEWIESHLIVGNGSPSAGSKSYRAEQLPYNAHLAANRHDRKNTHFYKRIIARLLDPSSNDPAKVTSREEKALLTLLDAEAATFARSLSAGALERADLQELVRLVDWYSTEGELPKDLDVDGRKMLRGIIEAQAKRLFSKIVRIEPRRLEEEWERSHEDALV